MMLHNLSLCERQKRLWMMWAPHCPMTSLRHSLLMGWPGSRGWDWHREDIKSWRLVSGEPGQIITTTLIILPSTGQENRGWDWHREDTKSWRLVSGDPGPIITTTLMILPSTGQENNVAQAKAG